MASFSDLLVGVAGTHPLVRPILNDFRFFDGGLEVSKEGIVVKLYFHALCFNDIVFLYCVVHFGHSRRLFALIVCSILLFKFLM